MISLYQHNTHLALISPDLTMPMLAWMFLVEPWMQLRAMLDGARVNTPKGNHPMARLDGRMWCGAVLMGWPDGRWREVEPEEVTINEHRGGAR